MNKKDVFSDIKSIIKIVITILSWAIFDLLILIGVMIVFYIISAQVYASKGQAYEPHFSLYTIISPSMEPNIKVYDVILDTKVDDDTKIELGDVITFISTSSLTKGYTITHRVVDIVDKDGEIKYRTKGDNNNSPDATLVAKNEIIGKTFLKIPQLGRIQFFLASRGGWIFAILIPAVGIILYDIIKMLKLKAIKPKIGLSEKEAEEEAIKQKEQEQLRKEKLKKELDIKEDEESIEDKIKEIEDIKDSFNNIEKNKKTSNNRRNKKTK